MMDDKRRSEHILKFLKDYVLAEIKALEFPVKNTLTAFKTLVENENKKTEKVEEEFSEENSDIDERYGHINDFKLKYIKIDRDFLKIDKKNLLLKKNQPKFGESLKNVSKSVKDYFRKSDLRDCALRFSKLNLMKEKIEKLKLGKRSWMELTDDKYSEAYRHKMSKYIFLAK